MTDLHRACKTLRTHLTQRRLLHATLDEQSETGVKAADYTPSDKPAPIDPPPRPDPSCLRRYRRRSPNGSAPSSPICKRRSQHDR